MLGGCARDPGGSASGTPPCCFTFFREDCVEPCCGNLSLPEGSETTPVVLCSTPSSLPEFTHTSLVAPPPGPCEATAGPVTDTVAQSPKGSETTPVVPCSNPSSLPEFTQTYVVAPPPGPCVVTAGPGTDPVALSLSHTSGRFLCGPFVAWGLCGKQCGIDDSRRRCASPATSRMWGTAWLAPSTLFP